MLRLGLVAILVFILFQPTLVLTSVVPQRNFVGILIDDSQSMRITDEDGVARSDFVRSTFGSEGSELLSPCPKSLRSASSASAATRAASTTWAI